ncbi:hypothetical protein HNQ59_000483 [Chitinivorax tropicus]|uniref:Outer membrane protein beta-barrel domain-containing protein n=1 Tax=Chitinivorax tropicus TaxID=714531 RepID=A0A840MPP7_9PROT|nr:hypothetical protein [Chitinivorax tropicus]MBB5017221.1 hypothetical protein [Chitinivorax tropicus]
MKKIVAVACLLVAGSASAVGVGLRAGTTGVGGDVGMNLIPMLDGRLGWSGLNYNRTINDTDVEYDGKLRMRNFSALVDFSVAGPFRLTGGLVYADNKLKVTGKPRNGTYTFNGRTYTAAEIGSASGEVKGKNTIAPYLGVGYGSVAGAGVNFYADLGVMLAGGSKTSLTVDCGTAIIGTPQCTQLQADAEEERRKLDDKVSGFKVWPVINIGVTIGF